MWLVCGMGWGGVGWGHGALSTALVCITLAVFALVYINIGITLIPSYPCRKLPTTSLRSSRLSLGPTVRGLMVACWREAGQSLRWMTPQEGHGYTLPEMSFHNTMG